MTLQEIKDAVDAGEPVRWFNDGYHVIKDRLGRYLVVCQSNSYTVDLTSRTNELQGDEDEFYIAD